MYKSCSIVKQLKLSKTFERVICWLLFEYKNILKTLETHIFTVITVISCTSKYTNFLI